MATVGVRIFDLHVPGCRSLKEKRFAVRGVKERIANRYNVAVAEVGHQDKWQRLELAVATVGPSRSGVERTLDAVRSVLDGQPEMRVIDVVTEIY